MIRQKILELAFADMGIKEIPQNRGWEGPEGKRLETEMRQLGWTPPNPYCAYWGMKIWYHAYLSVGRADLADLVVKTLSPNAQQCYKKAQDSQFKISGTPQPGSIGIMALGDTSKGHLIIVGRVAKNGLIDTFEANTNFSGSRDGDGLYQKRRNVSFAKRKDGLYFLGFINPIEVSK